VLSSLTAAADRRLSDLILAGARRRWPLLRFVPARWLAPATGIAARRARRSLVRGAILVTPVIGCAIVVAAVLVR